MLAGVVGVLVQPGLPTTPFSPPGAPSDGQPLRQSLLPRPRTRQVTALGLRRGSAYAPCGSQSLSHLGNASFAAPGGTLTVDHGGSRSPTGRLLAFRPGRACSLVVHVLGGGRADVKRRPVAPGRADGDGGLDPPRADGSARPGAPARPGGEWAAASGHPASPGHCAIFCTAALWGRLDPWSLGCASVTTVALWGSLQQVDGGRTAEPVSGLGFCVEVRVRLLQGGVGRPGGTKRPRNLSSPGSTLSVLRVVTLDTCPFPMNRTGS